MPGIKRSEDNTTLTISLPRAMRDEIAKRARAEGASVSVFLRQVCIRQFGYNPAVVREAPAEYGAKKKHPPAAGNQPPKVSQ